MTQKSVCEGPTRGCLCSDTVPDILLLMKPLQWDQRSRLQLQEPCGINGDYRQSPFNKRRHDQLNWHLADGKTCLVSHQEGGTLVNAKTLLAILKSTYYLKRKGKTQTTQDHRSFTGEKKTPR